MVESITTKGHQHSEVDSLVEIVLLLQDGPLPPYCWRRTKDNLLSTAPDRWGKTKSLIRKVVSNRDIVPAELLHFALHKPDIFVWDKIGLLYWYIKEQPFQRENFSEVVRLMIDAYRMEEKKKPVVKGIPGSVKDLLRKKNSG